ncbi:hypothetical protein COCNU_03G003230 [Cocos nucifera]|uniref:Uncharacterized protein n=1 Tax=Cocos nucifera TaxID=13894 RepID=A0A8K0I2A6_COCNU|nr:hypothetical protein COCNU_03G003230 [Cocos nucifera]
MKEEKKIMVKKKRDEEERKREEEKKVEAKKEEKNKREDDKEGDEKKRKHDDERKRKEQNKKTDIGDKPKTLTYSLERRINKEHRVHKIFHLIEDSNYEICMLIKKTKIVPKSKEGFIKHSREYQDKGSLSEEDDAIIKIFLSERITFEVVFNNAEGGSIMRSNIYGLLFARMISDDSESDLYHKCIIAPIMIAYIYIQSSAPHHELVDMVGEFIFSRVSDDEKKEFRILFNIIDIENVNWHLMVMDMERKKIIHLNSIKYSAKYKANARKWHKILSAMFHIYCDNVEMSEWNMEEDEDHPS